MFGSKDLLFSSEKYGVAKSLRFRSGSSTYLNRTFGTPTNNKIWTWSAWIKRGAFPASTTGLIGSGTTGSNYCYFGFQSGSTLNFQNNASAGNQINATTAAVFRDPSAWYHIVLAVDTTQATNSNGVKIYINGNQQTLTFGAYTQNTNTIINSAAAHTIGDYISGGGLYFDGYMAEVNFLDGQALTPSSFGFYDNNGIWQPKGYTGTYGTNGFYLKFTDVGATSGANTGYGKDFSGFNTNYWATNNFNSTSTSTSYDSMYDSPVNASNGITGIGNYCVLNPIYKQSGATNTTYGVMATPSDGNLTAVMGAGTNVYGTISPYSNYGKWYAECTASSVTSDLWIGMMSGDGNINRASWISKTSGISIDNVSKSTAGFSAGNVIGIAVDTTANTIQFYVNNSPIGSAYSFTANWSYNEQFFCYTNSGATVYWNFGQQPFAYTPPSGYSALNTQNLSTPTITNGAAYMAAVTYTGSASTQSVTATSTNSGNNPNAVTFQPDLVWIKDRSNAQDHKWTDVVRGATKALESNTTDDEATDSNGVTAFNNNGFSLGTGTRAYSDSNGDSYIAWEWKENVSSGFDIVTYTGNGSARTISHSLNAVPNMIIVKARTTASTDQGWPVYHSANTSAPETDYLMLNTTAATADLDTVWNDTAPTSAVFSVGTNANVNANNDTYVAYLWAAIAGYSAFGSYAGNSSADGPFVYTGFRPRWIMIKITTLGGSAGYDWYIFDTSRDTYNAADLKIVANSSVIENQNSGGSSMAGFPIDILSNGFKIRNSGGNWNASSNTYIYAAFAENPFKISRAR